MWHENYVILLVTKSIILFMVMKKNHTVSNILRVAPTPTDWSRQIVAPHVRIIADI